MDLLISARRLGLNDSQEKKRTCHIMSFSVRLTTKNLKESEKRNKYQDIARELKYLLSAYSKWKYSFTTTNFFHTHRTFFNKCRMVCTTQPPKI